MKSFIPGSHNEFVFADIMLQILLHNKKAIFDHEKMKKKKSQPVAQDLQHGTA